jgi:DNA-binding NtrC family response regulator
MACVCIIDDKDVMRDSLTDILTGLGHEVVTFADPRQALESLIPSELDVIISDLKMPGMDGIELLRSLRARSIETPFVLMTAYASIPNPSRPTRSVSLSSAPPPSADSRVKTRRSEPRSAIGRPSVNSSAPAG